MPYDSPHRSRNYIDRRKWAKLAAEGKAPESALLRKCFAAEIKTPDPSASGPKLYSAVISTASVDRYGDTVAIEGWQLDGFVKTGGPVLWSHCYDVPPVGRSPAVRIEGDALVAEIEFASAMSPFAKMIEEMVAGGFLNATSVGFVPKKYERVPERGYDFLEQELLEFSIVPVPANADAVIQARAAGIDVSSLEEWVESAHRLLGDESTVVPRANLLALTKALGWQERVWSLPAEEFQRELESQQRYMRVDLGAGTVTENTTAGPGSNMYSMKLSVDTSDAKRGLDELRKNVQALTTELRALQAHAEGEIPPDSFDVSEDEDTEPVLLLLDDEAQGATSESTEDGAPTPEVACDFDPEELRTALRETVGQVWKPLFDRVDRLNATPKG